MTTLRRSTQVYLAVLTLGAALALALASLRLEWMGVEPLLMAAGWTLVLLLTLSFPMPFAYKTQVYLDTMVVLSAVLLFDPSIAIWIAALGSAGAGFLRRQSPEEACFNGAQLVLQVVAGSLTLALCGWKPEQHVLTSPVQLGLVIIAAVVMHLVNTASVATIIGIQEEQSPRTVWLNSMVQTDRAATIAHVAQVGIASLGALIADYEGWALGLLLFPAMAVYASMDQHVKLRKTIEAELSSTQGNLAEAQRIAQLGSWEWDIATDTWRWSDEAYRVLGLDPDTAVASRGAFVAAVHPTDRPRVETMLNQAASDLCPFECEYRLVRADGVERSVHVRSEVVTDARGQVARLIGTIHDITQRKQLEVQLAYQAYHDSLTGLPNRRRFMDHLDQALARSNRRQESMAILFLDLDRFKLVNDTLGHDAGDHLLCAVAKRVVACLRPGAMAARLGGDEFAILLEDITGPAEAEQVAARIAAGLADPFPLADQFHYVTTSIGIAMCGQDDVSAADLLRDADVALYQAKDAGRGQHIVFEPQMGMATRERVRLETDLRGAIDRHELFVVYQPKIDLTTNDVVGVEALVRWTHPDRGEVPPAVFIPIAEESDLIVTIGRWVLETACQTTQRWTDRCGISPPVSVNVSARQLMQPAFCDEVRRILASTGVEPARLHLEVREDLVTSPSEVALAAIQRLQALGLQVVIDNVGIGQTHLEYLKRLTIDTVKLDRSVVSGLGHDPESHMIARAVVGVAHGLGLKVIAQGVESPEQVHELRALGCDWAQGYLFSPPTTADTVQELIASVQPV